MDNKMTAYANGLSISYNHDLDEAMLVFYQQHPVFESDGLITDKVETVEVSRITVNKQLLFRMSEMFNQIQTDIAEGEESQEK